MTYFFFCSVSHCCPFPFVQIARCSELLPHVSCPIFFPRSGQRVILHPSACLAIQKWLSKSTLLLTRLSFKSPAVHNECKLKLCSGLKYYHALKPGFVSFQSTVFTLCTKSFTSPSGKQQCSLYCWIHFAKVAFHLKKILLQGSLSFLLIWSEEGKEFEKLSLGGGEMQMISNDLFCLHVQIRQTAFPWDTCHGSLLAWSRLPWFPVSAAS